MSIFTPAWKSENEKKALKAVEKCKDDDKLVAIALEAPLESVCFAAVEKLNFDHNLEKVVRESRNREMRVAALKKMTDSKRVWDIIDNSKIWKEDRELYKIGLTRISDPKWIKEIICRKHDYELCLLAMKQVNFKRDYSKSELRDIAENAIPIEARIEALNILNDPRLEKKLLEKVFVNYDVGVVLEILKEAGNEEWYSAIYNKALELFSKALSIEREYKSDARDRSWANVRMNKIKDKQLIEAILRQAGKCEDVPELCSYLLKYSDNELVKEAAAEMLRPMSIRQLRETVISTENKMNIRYDAALMLLEDYDYNAAEDDKLCEALSEMLDPIIVRKALETRYKDKKYMDVDFYTAEKIISILSGKGADCAYKASMEIADIHPMLLASYPTTEAIEKLFEILKAAKDIYNTEDPRGTAEKAQRASEALCYIYKNASDKAIKEKIEAIPQKQYRSHSDTDSCKSHDDYPAVSFFLDQ